MGHMVVTYGNFFCMTDFPLTCGKLETRRDSFSTDTLRWMSSFIWWKNTSIQKYTNNAKPDPIDLKAEA